MKQAIRNPTPSAGWCVAPNGIDAVTVAADRHAGDRDPDRDLDWPLGSAVTTQPVRSNSDR
jgi:hypothetical protein